MAIQIARTPGNVNFPSDSKARERSVLGRFQGWEWMVACALIAARCRSLLNECAELRVSAAER